MNFNFNSAFAGCNDYSIAGDNDKDIDSMNGKVCIGGDNNKDIDSMNGKVEVKGINNGNIDVMNGKIFVGQDNNKSIDSMNGKIEIQGTNNGNIQAQNGKIFIGGDNNKRINSINGNVEIRGKNNGTIESSVGNVDLVTDKLLIEREIISAVSSIRSRVSGNISNICCGNVNISSSKSSVTVNGKTYITGGGNVSVVNGKVYVNGKRVDNQSSDNSSKEINKTTFNNEMVIDFIEGKAEFKKEKYDINEKKLELGTYLIYTDGENKSKIFVKYNNQITEIQKEKIIVKYQKSE